MIPIPALVPVVASPIKAVGHDGAALFVSYRTGATYRYPGAPPHLAERIKTADCPARCVIDNVAGRYRAERVA